MSVCEQIFLNIGANKKKIPFDLATAESGRCASGMRKRVRNPQFFDVILELRRGEPHEWRIVVNSARAVDQILEGDHYYSERRTRDPDTGEFFLELERA